MIREMTSLFNIYFKRNKIIIFAMAILLLIGVNTSVYSNVKLYNSDSDSYFINIEYFSQSDKTKAKAAEEIDIQVIDGVFEKEGFKKTNFYTDDVFMFMVAFAALVAILLTSFESIDNFSTFSKTLPFSSKSIWLTKIIFGIVAILIFSFACYLMIYAKAPFLTEYTYSKFGSSILYALLAFALLMLVGTFTGNFISQIGTSIVFGFGILNIITVLVTRTIYYFTGSDFLPRIEMTKFYKYIENVSLDNIYQYTWENSVAKLALLIIILIGAIYLVSKISSEKEGFFYKFKFIEYFFRFFGAWCSSVIIVEIFGQGRNIVSAALFIVAIIIFNYFYKYIFKIKIGF